MNKTTDNEKNVSKMNSLAWISKTAGKQKWIVAMSLLLQSSIAIFGILYALMLKDVIDCAVKKDESGMLRAAFVFIALVVAQILFRALNTYLEEYAKATFENRFKKRLYAVLLEKDYGTVTSVHSGEWMNRLTSDTTVIAEGMAHTIPSAFGMLVRMCGALLVLVLLEPRFGAVIIPGGIAMLILTYCFRKKMKKLHKNIREKDGSLRMYLQERLGSMQIIRTFAIEEQVMTEANAKMKEHKIARLKRVVFSAICNAGFQGIMNGVYIAGAIYCCYGILAGTLTYGSMTAILQLINQVQNPVAGLSGVLPKYYAMLASAERLMEVEDFPEACTYEKKTADEIRDYYNDGFAGMGLKDVSFSYIPPVKIMDDDVYVSKDQTPIVLKDVNFEINKGDYVAFVGISGSGKSTILKLLMSLYPVDSGERYLKDNDGKVHELDGRWQRMFAYIPQGNHLMSGTIREIVAFGNPETMKDDKKIREALEMACASEFVNELELGIDTLLGERGQGLSEGQMQRIAIARAVFADCPVMILDEATSALDEYTEKRLLENFKQMTDKTVLIVTHRPAALEICNKRVELPSYK